MLLTAIKRIDNLVSELDFSDIVHKLWVITVFLSAIKNFFRWDLGRLGDDGILKYPVFSALETIPAQVPEAIMYICFISLIAFLFKNRMLISAAFIVNGLANFLLMSLDYFALHHDMLLSAMLFIAYGIFIVIDDSSWRRRTIPIILAITASTYFLSGIVKIDPNFLSGEMAITIIERSKPMFYWPLMEVATNFSQFLAWYAMIVEVIEPIILLFFAGQIKLYTMLMAFPFHMGILLTKTGTVYNLIYPAAFLLILGQKELVETKAIFVKKAYNYIALLFISFATVYLLLTFYLVLRNTFFR